MKMRVIIKWFLDKLGIKKEDVPRILIATAITICLLLGIYFLGSKFLLAMWIVNALLLGIVLIVIWIIAGFAIFKSLSVIAAELSLLVFLAQAYCETHIRSVSGDDALKTLIAIGIFYIIVAFLRSLIKESKTRYKVIGKDEKSWKKTATITLYLIFTILFIWDISLIVYPIINSLCVYQK